MIIDWFKKKKKKDTKIPLAVYVRFSSRGCDLETVSPVLTFHRHHGAVIQVQNHTPRHSTSWLAHKVTSLGEEVEPVPGCGH